MIEREFRNASVTYDREANSAYVYVAVEGSTARVHATEELVPGINMDVDRDGRLVGVEVLL